MRVNSLDDLVGIAEFYPVVWRWRTEETDAGLVVICEDGAEGVTILNDLPRLLEEARGAEVEALTRQLAEAHDNLAELQEELDELRASIEK